MKWKPNSHVRLASGETGTIKFQDKRAGKECYVVKGDDGREYYPTDKGITNYTADEKPAKKGLFGRKK